jgi:cystathionine gamma-synthase
MDKYGVRDVMGDPPCREQDLGYPLPDSVYAVSVSLPKWKHVIGYEEGDAFVLERLRTGYPRFFVPRLVRQLEKTFLKDVGAQADQLCRIYPDEATASRCAEYIRERADGWPIRVEAVGSKGAFAVVFPEKVHQVATDYWRYCGEGISGRHAAFLLGQAECRHSQGSDARALLCENIAADCRQNSEDTWLFPSGMAAVAAVQRALSALAPRRRSVQFDFPYVDVLRTQRELGAGSVFFPLGNAEALEELRGLVEGGEPPCGVFCELPSNPLLRSVDLAAIAEITRPSAIPLVVDDTVATNVNVDVFEYADLVTTSLTKYYSGKGDVLAGAVTLNNSSPLSGRLRHALGSETGEGLWDEDAITLLENSRDYHLRMERINETAPKLVEWLEGHSAIDRVWYPTGETRGCYDLVRREGGGYSGLFSILLKDAESKSPIFYDALEICKGPSLGANFSLACPYMLLAHYQELDWCEELGISRWLVRVSVGLEDFSDLRGRMEKAFAAIGH